MYSFSIKSLYNLFLLTSDLEIIELFINDFFKLLEAYRGDKLKVVIKKIII